MVDPLFLFVVKLAPGADTFKSSSLNALLRLLPLSGLALVDYLREVQLVNNDFVNACVQVYRARAGDRSDVSPIEFVIDLCTKENFVVQDAIRCFMNFDDDSILERAHNLRFADIELPDSL